MVHENGIRMKTRLSAFHIPWISFGEIIHPMSEIKSYFYSKFPISTVTVCPCLGSVTNLRWIWCIPSLISPIVQENKIKLEKTKKVKFMTKMN